MAFMDELEREPLLKQIFLGCVRLVATDLQERAGSMDSEELYENEALIPVYNPEIHDYTSKPIGYVCKTEDGIIMQLLDMNGDAGVAALSSDGDSTDVGSSAPNWRMRWSKDPMRAKEFVQLDSSPYDIGDCAINEGILYRSKISNNLTIPTDTAEGWMSLGPVPVA